MRNNRKLYIIDGQHRYLALLELGFTGNTTVSCIEHTSLTQVREIKARLDDLTVHPEAQKAVLPFVLKRIVANFNIGALGVLHVVDPSLVDTAASSKLFLELGDRGAIGPYEKFKNRVQAGDPVAVACQHIANDVGLRVQKNQANGAIICTNALESAYRLDGTGEALRTALATLLDAWGRNKESVTGTLVAGFARFFAAFPDVDASSLARKMAKGGTAVTFEGNIRSLMELTHASSSKACMQLLVQRNNTYKRKAA